jgi:fructosamine-3-kinase
LFAALVLAGCTPPTGGAIKHDELQRGVLTLGNTAGAGQLLTVGVIQDRTKTTFVRVNARDLSDEATHEAEKLQDAESNPDLTGAKRQAVVIAQQIAGALSDLQVSPKDPNVARDVGHRLSTLEHRATQLAAKI